MEKEITHVMGKVLVPIPQSLFHTMLFLWVFKCYEKLKGKPIHFPYDEVDPTVKFTHTMKRVWELISQVFPI